MGNISPQTFLLRGYAWMLLGFLFLSCLFQLVQRAWEKTVFRISALTWTGLLVDQRSLASVPGLSDRSRWHVLVLGLAIQEG